MGKGLTDKQEKYVQGLLIGLSQRQAYKEAYSTKNWKVENIDSKASTLLKNEKVRARYDELHDKVAEMAEKECLFTVESVLRDLKDILDRNKEVDDKLSHEVLKTAGKHLGMFIDKLEVKVKEMPEIKITK